MIRDFPDVTYIIIGSKERLSKVKSYQIEEGVECLLCPFSSIEELPSLLDSKIAELQSEVISIIPAGAFPKKLARKQLLNFSKSNPNVFRVEQPEFPRVRLPGCPSIEDALEPAPKVSRIQSTTAFMQLFSTTVVTEVIKGQFFSFKK